MKPPTRRSWDRIERTAALVLVTLMVIQAALGRLVPTAYRDVEWIELTWVGNDYVTLIVAAPVLLTCVLLSARGSVRGRLISLGAAGYAVYNYAFYLLGAELNAFFVIYLLTFVWSVITLVITLARTDAAALSTSLSPRTPVRILGGYYIFVALGLSAVWLGVWAAYVFAGRPTPVDTEVFHVVAALDMSLLVPPLLIGGVLLWQRLAWGLIISALAAVQASLYLLVLVVNSLLAINAGLTDPPGELPIWGPLLLLTSGATVWLLASAASDRPSG